VRLETKTQNLKAGAETKIT